MLACISCAKRVTEEDEEEDEGARGGAPGSKEPVKSLTSQIKDMALKVSSSKSSMGINTNKKGHSPYPDFDTASEGVPYPYMIPGSSSSTPAWDFTSNENLKATGSDTRFTGAFSGDRSPRTREFMASRGKVLEDEDDSKEWMAQVEPGVHITFVSLPSGGNDLKRIRFSREMFNKWQAQQWWGENYDRIMELYNVQRFNRQAFNTPPRSEYERDSSYSRMGSERGSPIAGGPSSNKEWIQNSHYEPNDNKGYCPSDSSSHVGNHYYNTESGHYRAREPKGGGCSVDAARITTSSRDENSVSVSHATDMDSEWIEHDEPGVYITIRQMGDGTRELRRVRFSREKFGEVHAKQWWEENKERIQAQYL